MKLHGVRDKLVGVMSVVAKAIPAKSTIPVAQGVLMEVEDGKLVLTSNNLDFGIRGALEGLEAEGDGSCVLPSRFVDVLRNLPKNEVSIVMKEERGNWGDNTIVEVNSGTSRFRFHPMPAEDFPSLRPIEEVVNWDGLSLGSGDFREAVSMVSFAAGREVSRPCFTGILLEGDELGRFVCTASDGYRLARVEKEAGVEKPFRLLVPCKNLTDISRFIFSDLDEIQCHHTYNEIIFFFDNYMFSSRLLEDDYPDLTQVFPSSYHTKITINKEDISGLLSRALLAAPEGVPKIGISCSDGVLKASVREETGTFDESVEVQQEGEGFEETLYNIRYLYEPLNVLKCDEVDIEFTKTSDKPPVCVYRHKEEQTEFRYLVLPILVT